MFFGFSALDFGRRSCNRWTASSHSEVLYPLGSRTRYLRGKVFVPLQVSKVSRNPIASAQHDVVTVHDAPAFGPLTQSVLSRFRWFPAVRCYVRSWRARPRTRTRSPPTPPPRRPSSRPSPNRPYRAWCRCGRTRPSAATSSATVWTASPCTSTASPIHSPASGSRKTPPKSWYDTRVESVDTRQ